MSYLVSRAVAVIIEVIYVLKWKNNKFYSLSILIESGDGSAHNERKRIEEGAEGTLQAACLKGFPFGLVRHPLLVN